MADRKYASDYRMENQVDIDGKIQSVRVYRGTWYRFPCTQEEARKRGGQWMASAALLAVMLFPLLMSDTPMSHTFYVLLPMAFVLIPVYHLAAVGWRMRSYGQRMTRQEKDLTQGRLRSSCIWLVVLSGIALAGGLVYWWRQGLVPGDGMSMAGLAGTFLLALLLLKHRKNADVQEV